MTNQNQEIRKVEHTIKDVEHSLELAKHEKAKDNLYNSIMGEVELLQKIIDEIQLEGLDRNAIQDYLIEMSYDKMIEARKIMFGKKMPALDARFEAHVEQSDIEEEKRKING